MKAYMGDEIFLNQLWRENFDIAIGSLNLFADTILFRTIEVKSIKISQEDIESYSMQVLLNIPVALSLYPSKQAFSNFKVGRLPEYDSLKYRASFWLEYQGNKLKKLSRRANYKKFLNEKYHRHITDWD